VKIPTVIHRIWLGDEPMPSQYVRFGDSWADHHPGWEFRLWTDADLPSLAGLESLERCRNFGEASDVLRYAILNRYGGVYVDTDVECLRSLEPLVGDATAFAAYARPGLIGSAVVGAVPGHPAIARTLEVVSERAGSGSQVEATGPVALTDVLKDAPDVELFGRETFYPLDYWEIPFADAQGAGVADAYAIHHWHATWQSRETLMLRTRELMRRTRKLKSQHDRVEARLERRLERRSRNLAAALRREERLRRRLERMERSRWWRLGTRLNRVARLGRRRPGGGRGRAS
jgi:inositol phosphorylceramide mannosyltransferase catalytic subunit